MSGTSRPIAGPYREYPDCQVMQSGTVIVPLSLLVNADDCHSIHSTSLYSARSLSVRYSSNKMMGHCFRIDHLHLFPQPFVKKVTKFWKHNRLEDNNCKKLTNSTQLYNCLGNEKISHFYVTQSFITCP